MKNDDVLSNSRKRCSNCFVIWWFRRCGQAKWSREATGTVSCEIYQKKMFIKHPCTAIFTGPPGVGKKHLVLDMIETQYNKHFNKIIILCPTIRWNKTYIGRSWVIKDENVWLVEPKDKLFNYVEKLSNFFNYLSSMISLLMSR